MLGALGALVIGWLPAISVFCLTLALMWEVGIPIPHAGAWFVGGLLAKVLSDAAKVRA